MNAASERSLTYGAFGNFLLELARDTRQLYAIVYRDPPAGILAYMTTLPYAICDQHVKARLDLALLLHTLHHSERVTTMAESCTEQSKARLKVKARSLIDYFTDIVPLYLSMPF